MFYYKHYYIFQTVMFGNVHCNVIIWKLRHFPVRLFFFLQQLSVFNHCCTISAWRRGIFRTSIIDKSFLWEQITI